MTQAQREGILAGIVVALFAFGGAWFLFTMLRWLYSDSEVRATHPRIQRYRGLFGLPGLLISVGCLALAIAFGLDPLNRENPPGLWTAICFWIISVAGASSLLCTFVYGGWHYMDSIADLRQTGDKKALVTARNREILVVGLVLSAGMGILVMMVAGEYSRDMVLALALAVAGFALAFLVITLLLTVVFHLPRRGSSSSG